MKHFILLSAVVLAGCSQTGIVNSGSLVAPLDLVFVDKLPDDGLLARVEYVNNAFVYRGLPSSQVFITSTDTNELRVFETFRTGAVTTNDWARAPDPLETLSIPVTDFPDRIAVDEGRGIGDTRRTGEYVYAARRGGRELSIVSTRYRKTLVTRAPLPAAMSAMTAWMDIVDEKLPATTTLYLATWDGETGRVLRTTFSTDESQLVAALSNAAPSFTQLAVFDGETIQALQVVAPNANRTLDGAPFCATSACLALATRSASGGRTVLVDLATNVSANLSFGGPVRELAVSTRADGDVRIYGVLDEERCGGPNCGGVLSVDIVTGTGGAFPISTDLSSLPMQPMRVGTGLISGLTIGAGAQLATAVESVSDAGIAPALGLKGFVELGAFSSTNGYVSFFNPEDGLLIDFEPRRADLNQAVLRRPGLLADGGLALTDPDGGLLGTQELATLSWAPYLSGAGDHSLPWRDVTVTASGMDWRFEVFDGYFGDESVYVVAHGSIPGLTTIPSADSDGTHLPTIYGYESFSRLGDTVAFFTGDSTNGYTQCGRSKITAISAGFIDVDAVPPECVNRAYYTVLAGQTQPLVMSADSDGFMARGEPGETMVFSRRLFLSPGWVGRTDYTAPDDPQGYYSVYAPRDALRVTTPVGAPLEEAAAMIFSLFGYQTPYRTYLDVTQTGSCYISTSTPSQIEIGTIAMGFSPRPLATGTEPQWQWTTVGTIPTGNAMLTMTQSVLEAGPRGSQQGVLCWQ